MPYTVIATVATVPTVSTRNSRQPHGDAGKNPQQLTPIKVDFSLFLPMLWRLPVLAGAEPGREIRYVQVNRELGIPWK
jgi:hypothetical protein